MAVGRSACRAGSRSRMHSSWIRHLRSMVIVHSLSAVNRSCSGSDARQHNVEGVQNVATTDPQRRRRQAMFVPREDEAFTPVGCETWSETSGRGSSRRVGRRTLRLARAHHRLDGCPLEGQTTSRPSSDVSRCATTTQPPSPENSRLRADGTSRAWWGQCRWTSGAAHRGTRLNGSIRRRARLQRRNVSDEHTDGRASETDAPPRCACVATGP